MTYRIIESFENGVKGHYENFELDSSDVTKIKKRAVSIVRNNYKDRPHSSYPLPTIKIIEVDTITNRKKKNGLSLTATWTVK